VSRGAERSTPLVKVAGRQYEWTPCRIRCQKKRVEARRPQACALLASALSDYLNAMGELEGFQRRAALAEQEAPNICTT
jgi:hypothetical protein